jgi:hypothetical protein
MGIHEKQKLSNLEEARDDKYLHNITFAWKLTILKQETHICCISFDRGTSKDPPENEKYRHK